MNKTSYSFKHTITSHFGENETGRSMVEMLGVLAIVGVLSVGGIAGYRYAMTKYNANEIINEIRKRAVVASIQRIQGHAIDLTEFGNAFPIAIDPTAVEGTFALKVTEMSQSVCEEIKKQPIPFALSTPDEGCNEGDTNSLTFTFANDLSLSNGKNESEDENKEEEDELTPVPCPNQCGMNGDEPYCCPSGEICYDHTNTRLERRCYGTDGCSSYLDCAQGEYCKISDDGAEGGYNGTCQPIGTPIPVTIGGKSFITASETMTWWAAQDWCIAQNKAPATTSMVGCDTSKILFELTANCPLASRRVTAWGELINDGYGGSAYQYYLDTGDSRVVYDTIAENDWYYTALCKKYKVNKQPYD